MPFQSLKCPESSSCTRTIYWERENFNTEAQAEFTERRAVADSLMKIACKKYKDVYFIVPDAALHNGESSTPRR